jgi:uncharacterized protein (TIGR02466 family)
MNCELFNIFPTTLYLGKSENHIKNKESFYKVYEKYDFEDTTVSETSGNPLLHLDGELDFLFKEVISHVENYLYNILLLKKIFNIAITKTWISRARNLSHEIPWHIHSTSHVSFVYYLNVPENSNSIHFLNYYGPNNLFLGIFQDNEIQERMLVEDYNEINAQSFYLMPEEGHILLFPSSLRHSTQNNNIEFDGERLSIVGDISLILKPDQFGYSMGYLDPKYWKVYQ